MEKRNSTFGLKNDVLSKKKVINYPRQVKPPKVKKQSLLAAETNREWNSGNPFELGVAYLKNKNYEKAINSLYQSIETDAEDNISRYGLGVAFMSLEKFEEAITEFKLLLQKEPDSLEARLNLGIAYFKIEKFDNCIKEFSHVLRQSDTEENKKRLVNAYYHYGNQLYKKRAFELAANNYNMAASYDINNPVFFHMLGLCYKELDYYHKSVSSFENALKYYESKEKKLEIFHLLIELKIKNNENDEALNLCYQVLDISPDNAGANYLVGEIFFNRKEYDIALKRYIDAVNSDPGLIQALINIGQIYVFKNFLNKALGIYQEVLKIDPKNPAALCNISIIKYKQGDKKTAFEQLSRLSGKEGENNYLVQKYLGIILLEKEMIEGAIIRLTKSIYLNPDDPDNYINLGVCFHKQNNLERAIAEYSKALAIEPDNLFGLKNLALLYYDSKQKTEAIELYEKILTIEPDYKLAYKNTGNVYKLIGETYKAIEQYLNYLELDSKNTEVLFDLAVLLFEIGESDDSAETFKKLLAVNPGYAAEAYCYLSKIHERKGQLNIALDYARHSVYMNNNYVEGHIQFALICLRFGNKEKAKICLERVIVLEPANKQASSILGELPYL